MTKIPITKIYVLLNVLEQKGMVKSYFEVVCCECKDTTALVYESLDDIPQEYVCDNCGYVGSSVEGAVLIYKVIRDGK